MDAIYRSEPHPPGVFFLFYLGERRTWIQNDPNVMEIPGVFTVASGGVWSSIRAEPREAGRSGKFMCCQQGYENVPAVHNFQRFMIVFPKKLRHLAPLAGRHLFFRGLDHQSNTGWWFGTSILFSHLLGMSSSQLTFIFFRGVAQPPTRICLGSLFS